VEGSWGMRPALSSLARSGQRLSAATSALRGFTRTGFTVYTRTGDKGKSSLFNGERRRKVPHRARTAPRTARSQRPLAARSPEEEALRLHNN